MSNIILPFLLAQESFKNDLTTLLGLTPKQIQPLAQLVEYGRSHLSKVTGISPELAIDVMPIVMYLYLQARGENVTSTELVDELLEIGKNIGATISDEQAIGLRVLFDPKPALDQKDAIRLAKGNVLPIVDTALMGTELRSVDDIRTGEHLGVIPITTLNLRLKYPDGHTDSVSVELSEEALKVLSTAIETATKDLGRLKKQASEGLKVLDEQTD